MKYSIRNILGITLMFPMFISMFTLNHFISWLIFGIYILLLGLVFLFSSFLSNFEKIENKINKVFMRTLAFIVGVGMIMFFSLVWSTSYLDISAYFSESYETVRGYPSQIGDVSSKSVFQQIEINHIKLKSVYEIHEKDFNKELEATYLPRSKYVIKLWIYK
ncbi:hypothetical protein [Paenibacillus sp. NFR01]|uniref:hypothetical protein n=1 Tax=Paenibacillus sp. NFR01 TaxID=1566279 RepID=UPI0008B816BA|nr:hypothetical protein [Paenibacillus sp. NFR01]SES88030.1 hypothetical protein SAMN03159358_0190 [Paenibacillus sp. NFR01]